MAEPNDLTGRVAVVSGAARGQGREIAERLVRAGVSVIAGDVLEDVHGLATEMPDHVHAGALDVASSDSWANLIDAGADRFGGVDILVNNAGVLRTASIARESEQEFERVWRVNCFGAFLGMQAVIPYLRRRGAGVIVNTISTAALSGFAGFGAYASSKWALRGLTKVAALELAAAHIRVNAVAPGPVLTPMVVHDDDPAMLARLAQTPLGRAGLPSDIADLVLFLVSDQASFITGAEFVIDGGQSAGPGAAR